MNNFQEMLLKMVERSTTKIYNSPSGSNYLARVVVDFGGVGLVLKGFIIHCKENDLWVTPPQSTNGQGQKKYQPLVFFEDIEVWRAFQNKIIDDFKQQPGWSEKDTEKAATAENEAGTTEDIPF